MSGTDEESILMTALLTSGVMKKALLISLREDNSEIESLLHTLEIDVSRRVIQKRVKPHTSTFLGPGKLDEAVSDVQEEDIDIVVVNGVLQPSQHHMLEMRFRIECIDRIGVILEIFAERAHTEEAKKQVTLARMRYELPFLREWIHKAKAGERPGFLSGGAYATEVYYEHARSHVKRIEKDLTSKSNHRKLMRTRRRESGYLLVSIAGYTNAGKSALMNALCDASVEVDDKLFATLSTTTRKIKGTRRKILVTDTVGFISDLPASLVHAFQSTFEEVFLADVILLAMDASEEAEIVEKKAQVCLREISAQHEQRPLILVGTKDDLLTTESRGRVEKVISSLARSGDWIFVSSVNGRGLDELICLIESRIPRDCAAMVTLPICDQTSSLISELHDIADLSEVRHTDSEVEILVKCSSDDFEKIAGRVRKSGGTVVANG